MMPLFVISYKSRNDYFCNCQLYFNAYNCITKVNEFSKSTIFIFQRLFISNDQINYIPLSINIYIYIYIQVFVKHIELLLLNLQH
jgi:hypothetical protein